MEARSQEVPDIEKFLEVGTDLQNQFLLFGDQQNTTGADHGQTPLPSELSSPALVDEQEAQVLALLGEPDRLGFAEIQGNGAERSEICAGFDDLEPAGLVGTVQDLRSGPVAADA